MTPTRDIAHEPDFEGITTLERFRERVTGRYGVIVIKDDTSSQPVAHHRECFFVDEDSFTEKVLDNAERNGRYWWAKNSRIAAEQLGARRCRHPSDKLSRG
jgi:hypothetical protein